MAWRRVDYQFRIRKGSSIAPEVKKTPVILGIFSAKRDFALDASSTN